MLLTIVGISLVSLSFVAAVSGFCAIFLTAKPDWRVKPSRWHDPRA